MVTLSHCHTGTLTETEDPCNPLLDLGFAIFSTNLYFSIQMLGSNHQIFSFLFLYCFSKTQKEKALATKPFAFVTLHFSSLALIKGLRNLEQSNPTRSS